MDAFHGKTQRPSFLILLLFCLLDHVCEGDFKTHKRTVNIAVGDLL